MPPIPFAHEAWFGPDEFPSDWSFTFETLTLGLLAAAVAVTVAVPRIATRFPGVDVGWLARCAPFTPFAVRTARAAPRVGSSAASGCSGRRVRHRPLDAASNGPARL